MYERERYVQYVLYIQVQSFVPARQLTQEKRKIRHIILSCLAGINHQKIATNLNMAKKDGAYNPKKVRFFAEIS